MTTMKPEEYQERIEAAPPFQMHIVTYRLGSVYHCTIDNVDPGAVLVRADGATAAEAETRAMARARSRLAASAQRINPS